MWNCGLASEPNQKDKCNIANTEAMSRWRNVRWLYVGVRWDGILFVLKTREKEAEPPKHNGTHLSRRKWSISERTPCSPTNGMLQRRPIWRTLHDVIILVRVFNLLFHKNHRKNTNCPICFPPGRELWLTLGMRRGGKSQKNTNKTVRTKNHTSGHFSKRDKKRWNMFIYKMTPNPISALKISICNTNYTSNTQIYFQNS